MVIVHGKKVMKSPIMPVSVKSSGKKIMQMQTVASSSEGKNSRALSMAAYHREWPRPR